MNEPRIFLDLDGVMADFDAAFAAKFGVDNRSLADAEMWAKINASEDFFAQLPPCPGAIEFYYDLRTKAEVTILTACPKDQYEHVARQKKAWVSEHLSKDYAPMVIPTPGGKAKALFVQTPGDILIDDFYRNTSAWTEAGGVSILHKDFETTKKILTSLGMM